MQNNTFSGLIIGQNVITIDRVSSTNDYFKDNLSKFTPQDEGSAILAVEQYAGKGQRGNMWITEPGKNIITSILLYPHFLKIDQQFALSCAICLGIMKWLKTNTKEVVQIKWPNDIYVNQKKISGLLIENSIKGDLIGTSIIGIGVNINQTTFIDNPHITSLKSINDSHEDYDIASLANELYLFLDQEYKRLKQGNQVQQLQEFNQYLFRKNEIKTYKIADVEIEGKIIHVLPNGQLQAEIDREIMTFNLHEIKYVL
ncbi:biotin--[acetyl-CoA-carboxylase] ligase [Sphingobacterium sp. PCS056]|uniref:biotin--[acetyl-CoA-carboxylase] ligase n=1 Tax=Sphingobacterium sp. PCS056 TaxID=2931400 RepID=UPI00200FA3C8|nr:biotin--[acetyl-CoA-carboxylase] ligase [Sphingobacterium sp. PCS056]UPZ37741.1 biotin--[acetyl-CoA-carboxylase] ligase [Sphingobacterium sp. PCS056]